MIAKSLGIWIITNLKYFIYTKILADIYLFLVFKNICIAFHFYTRFGCERALVEPCFNFTRFYIALVYFLCIFFSILICVSLAAAEGPNDIMWLCFAHLPVIIFISIIIISIIIFIIIIEEKALPTKTSNCFFLDGTSCIFSV